jgi:hypothetical protein
MSRDMICIVLDLKKEFIMASSVAAKNKVTAESQKVEQVLQTENIFLFVPNIIGETRK